MSDSKRKLSRRKPPFIMRHEEWLNSPAYRALKPVARCLLEEFQRIYRRDRNGCLSISVAKASELLGCHADTASKAFHKLAQHGFLTLCEGEYWQERIARKWELTIEPSKGREPSDLWRCWEPSKPIVELPKKSKTRSQIDGQGCPIKRGSVTQIRGQSILNIGAAMRVVKV